MRIHVDIDPWAPFCRVYLGGVDIGRWCRGADDERNTITVDWPGGPHGPEEREIQMSDLIRISGVEEAREAYAAARRRRYERAGMTQLSKRGGG